MGETTSILVNSIRKVLSEEPVKKAWLFGSYARGQESIDSDMDILVEMAPNNLTMLGFLKIQTKLERATHKSIDLIEDRYLADFARKTADNEKVLIYEAV